MTGWHETRLGEVFEISSSKRVLQEDWKTSGVPFYRAREIVKLAKDGVVDNELFISEEQYETYRGQYGVPKAGDLMVSAVGTLGACYVVQPTDRFYYKDASVLRLSPKREICSRYIWHTFQTQEVIDQIHAGSGSTVGTYTIQRANKTKIRLPPLPEQRRIAAILDQADALRAKRREALAQLDELQQAIFIEMFGDPATNPNGWPITTVGDLLKSASYGTSEKSASSGQFPVLRMNNITRTGEFDLSDLKYMDLADSEHERYLVKTGDVLFNRTNSAELVGKTAIFREQVPMAYAGYLIRLRTNESNDPEYLSGFMNTPYTKRVLRGMCKSIIGMANINATEVQSIKIAKPPLKLQTQYRQRIGALLQVKACHRAFLTELDSLFSSLQYRAFRGEL